MTTDNHPHSPDEKRVTAYNRMMERVKHAIDDAQHATQPRLHRAIESAKEKAFELGELSREEAEKIGDYLRRDVENAANYLTGPKGEELKDWLRFDLALAEKNLVELLFSVADQTRLDLLRLEQQAQHPNVYKTGELTGIGTLICTQCGQLSHFHKTGHIPPCASCNNTLFERLNNKPE